MKSSSDHYSPNHVKIFVALQKQVVGCSFPTSCSKENCWVEYVCFYILMLITNLPLKGFIFCLGQFQVLLPQSKGVTSSFKFSPTWGIAHKCAK